MRQETREAAIDHHHNVVGIYHRIHNSQHSFRQLLCCLLQVEITMSSGVSSWHKQQRKKEQSKNKVARIAARDAKVKETKTVTEIDDEIRKLKRQFKTDETMPHSVRSKLERLQKERKLVQEELDKQPREAPKVVIKKDAFQPLSNPKVSVYFDPVMNPYGEPPPGQPRLYHRLPSLGGGVTRSLEESWVPGEPEVLRPPPPPPPRQQQQEQHVHSSQRDYQRSNQNVPRPATSTNQNQSHERSGPSSWKQPKVQSSTTGSQPSANKRTEPEEPKVSKFLQNPDALPEMPQASASVKRRGLNVDIWASNDEIEYEQVVGTFDGLEGLAEDKGKVEWYYRDRQDQVQGPYPEVQITQWVKAGFFPADTPMRTSKANVWKPLTHYRIFSSVLPEAETKAKPKTADTVQDRIALLKQQQQQDEKEDQEDSVQARIARLKGLKPSSNDADEAGSPESENSVQARISALKQQLPTTQASQQEDNDKSDYDNSDDSETLQARIAAIRGESSVPAPSPPPPPKASVQDDQIPAYAYPVDSDNETPPYYPVDNDAVVDDDMDDIPYPTDDAYPVTDDYPNDDSYPVTDAYPIEPYPPTEGESEVSAKDQGPPKKKVKVDKDIVAFLPSHLQKRNK